MITAPLYIQIGSKKHYLTLNNYRNWHYQLSNKLKKEFKKLMFPQLHNKQFNGVLHIKYTLFRGDKKRVDLDNMLAVQSKFFQDTLTELNCIEEDNIEVIRKVSFEFGGYDKGNGHIEIEIYKMEC